MDDQTCYTHTAALTNPQFPQCLRAASGFSMDEIVKHPIFLSSQTLPFIPQAVSAITQYDYRVM